MVTATARGQLSANFRSDSTQGCSPLFVKFFDLSTGNPTSWRWELGNGIISTQRNPTTFYFTPGTYTVKLVVKNNAGADSIIKTDHIKVFSPPEISFSASDTIGCVPVPVTFTNHSVPVSGTISAWQWDVGDGTFYSQQNPSHTYTLPGSYAVTLKATNTAGCSKTVSKAAYINVGANIKPAFNYTGGEVCKGPARVSFTNLVNGPTNLLYTWYFGDGDSSTVVHPVHAYDSSGVYPVKLVVRNPLGCIDSVIQNVVVSIMNHTASFIIPPTICQGAQAVFVNNSTPNSTSALWQFADGTTSTAIDGVKVFSTPGSVDVRLINTSGNCVDTVTHSVVISAKPKAAFIANLPPPSCKLPVTASFSSSTPGIATYIWNFGDGTTSGGPAPVHVYTNYDTLSISLVVIDSLGCTDTLVKPDVLALYPSRIAGFTGVPFSGCAPYLSTVLPDIISPEPVASYLWDFGDGNTSTAATPFHTWANPGIYDVKLSITTTNGCTANLTLAKAVDIAQRPVANFTAAPLIACANSDISLTDQSTGLVTAWKWDFGDGNTSSSQNPMHYYIDTGSFDIILVARNRECSDTLRKVGYVYIRPPIAQFRTDFECNKPLERRFTDLSKGATSWLWNFGDGNTSTLQNPVHTYAGPGSYLVKLIVFNDTCSNEYKETVLVIVGSTDFSSSDSMICHNTTTTFSIIQSGHHASSFLWDFGNGNTYAGADTIAKTNYTARRTYTVRLDVTDALGCTTVVQKNLPIDVLGPNAAFTKPVGACINTPVTFSGTSVVHPSYPLVSHTWDYSDGTKRDTTTANQGSHLFSAAGKFPIKLIVKDAYGCIDSLLRIDSIEITDPRAGFVVSDTVKCSQNDIQFTNIATGLDLQYLWKFGDGSQITDPNPLHSYLATGVYDVTLTVTDKYGCTNSMFKNSFIRVVNPVASFSMPDSATNCSPFVATMFNQSSNYTSILWDFDDGSFSAIDSPSHYFNLSGEYQVKLTAIGYGVCTATAVKPLIIKGPRGTIDYSPLALCSPGEANFVAHSVNSASLVWDFADGNTLETTDTTATHTYVAPGIFTPRLIMSDTLGCTVAVLGTKEIVVSKIATSIDTIASAYCDSAAINFISNVLVDHDVVSSYQWTFDDGNTSNQVNPVHTFNTPGTYDVRLEVVSVKGCRDTAGIVVKVVESPQIGISGDTAICINETGVFAGLVQAGDTTGVKWLWSFGNGRSDTLINPSPQSYSSANTYPVLLQAVNSSGCIDTVNHSLIVHPLPPVDAGLDSIICLGETITLRPSGAAIYNWVTNPRLSCSSCENPVATAVDTSNIFWVNGISSAGCQASDSVIITVVHPVQITTVDTDTLCNGESYQLRAEGADKYSWSPSVGLTDTAIADPVARPTSTTLYTVVGTDFRNCFYDTASVSMVVYPIPVFKISNGPIAASSGTVIPIQSTSSPDIIRWRWIPSYGLSCVDCPQPVLTAGRDITYRVVVFNEGGCRSEETLPVTVTCNEGNVYVPNTFSPNNDGMNDVFFPRGKGLSTARSLKIFNRWGGVVFQRNNFLINDATAGWNGMFNNQPAPADVYVYELDVICENNQIINQKGNITLLR